MLIFLKVHEFIRVPLEWLHIYHEVLVYINSSPDALNLLQAETYITYVFDLQVILLEVLII